MQENIANGSDEKKVTKNSLIEFLNHQNLEATKLPGLVFSQYQFENLAND